MYNYSGYTTETTDHSYIARREKKIGHYAFSGRSVTLSGNGKVLAVGGPQDNIKRGATWVFNVEEQGILQRYPKLVGSGYIDTAPQGDDHYSSVNIVPTYFLLYMLNGLC